MGIEFQVYLNVYCIWFKNILFSASKLIRWSSFMKILQYTVKDLDPTGSGLFSRIRTMKTFLSDPDLFDGSGQNGTDPDPTPSLLCCKCLMYTVFHLG